MFVVSSCRDGEVRTNEKTKIFHLVDMQSDPVSDFQGSIDGSDMENVTAPNLRVLHGELHPLQRNKANKHSKPVVKTRTSRELKITSTASLSENIQPHFIVIDGSEIRI